MQIGHSIYHHITLEGDGIEFLNHGKRSHRITYEALEPLFRISYYNLHK